MFQNLILTSKLLIKKDKFSEIELVLLLRELWSKYLTKIRNTEQVGHNIINHEPDDCKKFIRMLAVKEILKQLNIESNNLVLHKFDPGSLFTKNEKLQHILSKNEYICLSPMNKNMIGLQKHLIAIKTTVPALYKLSDNINNKHCVMTIGNNHHILNILKINRSSTKTTYYNIGNRQNIEYGGQYNTFDPSQIFDLYLKAIITNNHSLSEIKHSIHNSNIYAFLNANTKDHLHNVLIHNLLMLSENIIVPVEYRETIQNLFIEQWFDIETAKKIKLAITLNSTDDIIKMLITNKLKNENNAYNIPLLDMDIL